MRRMAIAAFATTLAFSANHASANLLTNGGFETGNFNGWTQFGNATFTGVDNSEPSEGIYSAFFGPVETTGGISQNFAAQPGADLVLTFDLFNIEIIGTDPVPNFASVEVNGITLLSLSNSAFFAYTSYSYNVTGDSDGTNTLVFTFQHEPSFWYLDNVSVEGVSVPEPATLTLLSLGLAGLGFSRRRAH